MKTKTNYRSNVFKRAHEIKKATNKKFSICLSKAWEIYRLTKRLINNDMVCFTFKKKDGSLRKAYGTLKNVGQFIKGTGTINNKVFHYWDLEAVAFRCFKVENLITTF